MASSNKTENYELNQWEKTDPVLMDDFNADNQKLDAALKSIADSVPRIVLGSYEGSGTYGYTQVNSLSFDFPPKLLVIGDGYTIARGQSVTTTVSGSCVFSWEGNTVSWYHSSSALGQLNNSGTTYHYLAIG